MSSSNIGSGQILSERWSEHIAVFRVVQDLYQNHEETITIIFAKIFQTHRHVVHEVFWNCIFHTVYYYYIFHFTKNRSKFPKTKTAFNEKTFVEIENAGKKARYFLSWH